MLRKGKNREIIHNLTNSILLDDLPHHKIAKFFSK